MHTHHPKNCPYCGRLFYPDRRIGERQKSCPREACRKKRKEESQRRWVEANPDCFRGRYENTKEWLQDHPGYLKAWRAKRRDIQDKIRRETPVKIMRLAVPVGLLGDIQDEIRLVRQCGCGLYVAGQGVPAG